MAAPDLRVQLDFGGLPRAACPGWQVFAQPPLYQACPKQDLVHPKLAQQELQPQAHLAWVHLALPQGLPERDYP